jgi:hypothetical protein
MRFASFIRPVARAPKVSTPMLAANDVAKALNQVLENQATIMNDLARIKNALPWIAAAPFEAAMDLSPNTAVDLFRTFGSLNSNLTQVLSG